MNLVLASTIRTFLAAALGVLLAGCLSFHPGRLPGEPAGAMFFEIGDTHVHYVDLAPAEGAPRGEPVVLLHGFGATLDEWVLVMPELQAAGHRVIALDLRGHGWSSRPDGDYSMASQARLVLDLLDRLGVDRFAVVGHSWGSAVALHAVIQAPERVTQVALYNGMFFDDQRPVLFGWTRAAGLGEVIMAAFWREREDEKLAFAFYDPERFITEDAVEQLDELMDRPGTRAVALASLRATEFSDLEPAYRQIEQPVLVIWGREDEVTPLEYGERLVNLLPDARLVVVPRCGHVPMIEAPTPTSNALVRFLAEGSS